MPHHAKILLVNLIVLLSLMLLLWIISLNKRDASIADQFWGIGYVVVAWLTTCLVDKVDVVGWFVVWLVTIWGLRLAGYLTWRKWGEGEDRRYAAMRDGHRERFTWTSLFTVFFLQGLLVWFISMPIQAALWNGGERSTAWFAVGATLWVIGFCFETVADVQLARFQAQICNSTAVMDQGLWRYSRHPNYFGDFCAWWGIYLIASAAGAAWTVASPITMSFLLLKVSGVSLLESTISDRRPDYAEYKERTSAFFPWRPRNT